MRRAYIKQIITTVLLIVMVLNGVVLESLALMNETQKETTKEGMITPDSPKYTEYVMKEDGLKEVNEKEGESPNAYVAKTLLVLTKEGVTDTYQATTYLQYGELWILQYNTERETQNAFKKFKQLEKVGKIISVEVNQTMQITSEEEESLKVEKNTEDRSTYLEMPISGKAVVAAVIDTGYDKNNMESDRIIDVGLNYAASGEKNSIQDDNGHGTMVSNIILENTTKDVKVMPIKVLNSEGIGSTLSVYSGIKAAIEHKVDIINISMSSKEAFLSPVIRMAITEAKEKGIFVVVSAGNQNQDISNFSPANIEEAVVVSSINSDLTLSNYSNYGSGIDFCSYGSINTCGLNNTKVKATGTSVAAAIISTVIANCKMINPNYKYEEIYQMLKESSFDLGEKGKDIYFGEGALALSTITGLYESYVCTQAEIFDCQWKKLSDEKLNEIIQNTTDINLSLFLQQLNADELEEIINRDTDLNKIKQTVTFDKNMKCLSEEYYTYYEYLLENNFSVQTTTFGSDTGYFYAVYNQIGVKEMEKGTTKITMKAKNIVPWQEFTEKPVYELSSSNTKVFCVAKEQPETQKDADGNYYVAYTKLYRKNVPAHYSVETINDNHVLADNSDAIKLDVVTTEHTDAVHDCYFVLKVDTNGAGLTWWGPEQAGGNNKDPNNVTVKHTTVTVDFAVGKEKLKINPNGGIYEYDGKSATKTFTLDSKECGESSVITTPTREGYEFVEWQVVQKAGAYGKLDKKKSKYVYCGSGGTTTLKAIWKKDITPTEIPIHHLTIDLNGGQCVSDENKLMKETYVKSFRENQAISFAKGEIARDKYDFSQWKIINGTGSIYQVKQNEELQWFYDGKSTGDVTIQAQWKPWIFNILYVRNEPSQLEKYIIEAQNGVSSLGKEKINHIGNYENAQFLGWCLAKGNWSKDKKELNSVCWLNKDGTFDTTKVQVGEKGIDTTAYTGKIFQDQASIQELVPYITYGGEELTLVGKWKIKVDYNSGDGINTKLLNVGQPDIAPDISFQILGDVPELRGTEFTSWCIYDGAENSINDWKQGSLVKEGFGKNTTLYARYCYYIQYQKADGTILKSENYLVNHKKTYDQNIVIGSEVSYPIDGNHQGYHYPEEKSWQVITEPNTKYEYADALHYPDKNYENTYQNGESAKVNRSVILRAVEKENTYTVQYHKNNDLASTKKIHNWEKMKEQTICYNGEVTLRDVSGSLLPGYEFSGWNTKADGTGAMFQNKESKKVKSFLEQTGAEINKNEAVIHLYAQWKPKSYSITFDTNSPTTKNNTHKASNTPILNGTKTMEFVWDSYVVNGKIEELNLPGAKLKGWHQRFQESLWYTSNKYNAPGKAIKEGTRLGYDILGLPGDKQVYAQWEANTYTVVYCGNGKQDGGRGKVQGTVEKQIFTYDVPSMLRENSFVKTDENYRYHDDEKLETNGYRIKHNEKAASDYKYYWLGWDKKRVTEGETKELLKPNIIGREEKPSSKVWNLTDIHNDTVILYALWDGIPNITTKTKKNHFDRYEGAKITAGDIKGIMQAYDLEQEKELKLKITNICYYEEDVLKSDISNPKDSYILDTSLPESLQKEGKYKLYTVTFQVEDAYGIKNYAEEIPQKTVTYTGRIYYNTQPEIKAYNDNTKLYDRYLYLQDIQTMEKEEVEKTLTRQVKIEDKEDSAYEKDRGNDLYCGRKFDNPILEIEEMEEIYKNIIHFKENWSEEEQKQGKNISHTIKYTDIFGKQRESTQNIHIVDVETDESLEENRKKQYVRFISKEYLDTLKGDSIWQEEEKYKKTLEETLNNKTDKKEEYIIENGVIEKSKS